MRQFYAVIVSTIFALSACTPAQPTGSDAVETGSAEAAVEHPHIFDGWYKGTPEQAFAEAQRSNKPLFLYWGAVWCPPCNEIKNEVFTKPEFAELMKGVIPVFLDGDLESAQIWSDKLSVSGYPTLLVLDKSGKEILRIAEFVNIVEFKESFLAALNANRPLEDTLKKLMAGKGSTNDWLVISFFNWDDKKDFNLSPKAMVETRKKLADGVPAELAEERAILAGRVLEAAADLGKEAKPAAATKAVLEKVRKDYPKYFASMTASQKSIIAARATLLYGAKDILAFAFGDPKLASYQTASTQWIDAVKKIRALPDMSSDTHLMSYYAEVDLKTSADGKPQLDPAFRQEILDQVEIADHKARGYYHRHAAISGAGDLLATIGEYDKARDLLSKELKTTDTPWYYQAELAQIEEKLGNKDKALEYSEDARKSARGSATRLQWITSDLLMQARLSGDNERIYDVLKEYYEEAFKASDGFSGRSQARAMKIARELKKYSANPKLHELIESYAKTCSTDKVPGRKGCSKHFAELVPTAVAR